MIRLGVVLAMLAAANAFSQESAQDHATRALDLLQRGELGNAERELREAVKLAPTDPGLLATLGSVLGMEAKPQQAAAYLSQALKLDPQNSATRRNLAGALWQAGRLKEAHENLDVLLKADPQDKAATFLMGMVCESEKNFSRSATLLESVPEALDRQPDGRAALADDYYHTGRVEEARESLKQLARSAGTPQAVFTGGKVAMQGGDFATAEALFVSIQSSYPDRAAIAFQIALAQYKAGRLSDAKSTLSNARESKELNADGYVLLSKALADEGAISQALNVAQEGDLAFPNRHEVLVLEGTLQMQLRYFNDAVVSYGKAVNLHASAEYNIEDNRDLATAYWRSGMREQAAARFDEILRRYPDDGATCETYGTLLLEDGLIENESRAVNLLKRSIDLSDSADARLQLANLELAKSNPNGALRYLERAVQIAPKDSRVHFALSRAYGRLGRNAEAEKEIEIYRQLKQAAQAGRQDTPALGTERTLVD